MRRGVGDNVIEVIEFTKERGRNMNKINAINPAYPQEYLESIVGITEFLFDKFISFDEYDYFSCVTEYMFNSYVRKGMDKGNPSALNKGIKQLINSVDFTVCRRTENSNSVIDGFVSNWIADIYVVMQWKYNIASSEIIQKLPCEELYKLYNPLHEASIEVAIDKLYKLYIDK